MSTLPPSTVQLPSASTNPSTHLLCLCTFYSYIFAAIFVYIFVHPRLHSSVDAQQCLYSTPTLICGCTAVSTMLQLHFRGHFRVHFCTSTPTFICGRTATSIFYTYAHLWMYTRSLQCYSYIFAAIFVYIFVHPRLHSSVVARVCVAYILRFSGPSLALFSRWQRVHGYTSLIRPRFHSSLHSTPTFSEHFRDPGVYKYSTFYIYILRTFSYIRQCSEPSDFYIIILHLANIFVIQASTYVLHSTSTFCEHFRKISGLLTFSHYPPCLHILF